MVSKEVDFNYGGIELGVTMWHDETYSHSDEIWLASDPKQQNIRDLMAPAAIEYIENEIIYNEGLCHDL